MAGTEKPVQLVKCGPNIAVRSFNDVRWYAHRAKEHICADYFRKLRKCVHDQFHVVFVE